jgi:hypothetical protein
MNRYQDWHEDQGVHVNWSSARKCMNVCDHVLRGTFPLTLTWSNILFVFCFLSREQRCVELIHFSREEKVVNDPDQSSTTAMPLHRVQGFIFFLLVFQVSGFVSKPIISNHRQRLPFVDFCGTPESRKEAETATRDMNPLTKASWYAVEAFGKVFGSKAGDAAVVPSDGPSIDLTRGPKSLQETLDRIQLDNDRSYFEGRDRFVDNLANLGSFITKYSAKMLDYQAEGTTVKTRVMVKLELNLPWKPVLAWPWGVTYEIDGETLLITAHKENWEIEPFEGVKQIFRKATTAVK